MRGTSVLNNEGKGRMSRQKKVFAILVILVLLCTWVIPACADPEALPEENEEIVAGDVLSDTDGPEETLIAASGEETEEEKDGEILPAVVSDGEKEEKEEEEQPNLVTEEEQEAEEEKKEEKEEELPGESGENIDLGEGFPEPVDSSDKSEPSEEQNQPEEKDDQEKEDDDIEFDPEEGDGKPAEDGQEDEQKDGQDETVFVKLEEIREDPAPAMAMLSLSKRGDIAEDQQKKTEEPPTEEPVMRNAKGDTGYTVTVSVEGLPNYSSSDYCVSASVGGTKYIGDISGGYVYFGAYLQLPSKPDSLAIVSKNNHNETLHEITINNKSYFIYDPILDEEKHECTIKVVQQTPCQIIFSSVPGTDMTGRYYIVVKRKGYGTPVAWAQIENGKMGSVQSRNNNAIYNDSTFVIIKTDDFDIDRYSSYPEKILQSGGQFSNSIIFTWNSTPILENNTYFYYINAAQINGLETEEHTEYGTITISTKGSDEQELSETTFALYEEEACKKAIRTFTGGSITVRTKEDLGDYLPTETGADHARTLYLKQTEVQTGYDRDENTHRVVITKTITEQLDETENKKTITTSYGITIDGANAVNIINPKLMGEEERKDGEIAVTVTDSNGAGLSESRFELYAEESCINPIKTYTGGSITISTADISLEKYLPKGTEPDTSVTLYLKETVAQAGYSVNTTVHPVVITKSVAESLNTDANEFIITTTYGITIDGGNAVNIANQKRMGEEARKDGSIAVTVTDSNGAELSGSTCNLYAEDSCKTEIKKYPGKSFTISTADASLEEYLPTGTEPNTSVTLYLKETETQAGYEADITVYPVVITKNVAENLNTETNEFIITTTYGITIGGKNSVTIKNTKNTDTKRVNGNVEVTVTDSDGAELNGSICNLYTEENCKTGIRMCPGGKFTISTADTLLEKYLPKGTEPDTSVTLYLKETTAQAGYEADITVYPVVITKNVSENLDTSINVFITTTTYGITIDGKNSVTIKNTKNTDSKREDGSIVIANKDSDGVALCGSTFKLYPNQECAEESELVTYTDQSFVISTSDEALKNSLPAATGVENATTLYLKQETAPTDYDMDPELHSVVITKEAETTYLDTENNMYITKTVYGITIDGESEVVITNNRHSVTNSEGNHSTPEGENNPTGEGNGDSTNTEGNGNTTVGGEGTGTTAWGDENNPTGEGNGGSMITEENGNVTNGGDDDGTNTGDSGETVTGEVNGKSATSGETVNNVTGGKDENSKNSSENGDETVTGSSVSVTAQERNNDNPNSQSNQDEKAPGTAAINTNSGSITVGNDEAMKPTEQGETAVQNDGTETKPLTTKTRPWSQALNTNKNKAPDEQNEDIIIQGVGIEQVVSLIQEAIRIITRIGELLSALARNNIFAFLK